MPGVPRRLYSALVNDDASRDAGAAGSWLRRISLAQWLMLFLAACLTVFVLRNYYLKPYSDPLNWLNFARNFASEIKTSKFPLGYPVFLQMVLPLTGPFFVFLSNLPLLILLMLLVGRLAHAAGLETGKAAAGAGLMACGSAALLLMFDPAELVYLTNPYRDPLSHVLLFSSLLLFIRYIRTEGKSLRSLAGSALLLGASFCVRETALLIVPVLALYGLIGWLEHRAIGFWKTVLLFGACLFIGSLPLLLQGYFRTGQMLVPPQAAVEHKLLPGVHFEKEVFVRVSGMAVHYLWSLGGILHTFGLATGILFGILRRNRVILAACLPAVVVHFLFYSLYWTFVARYFFIVPLLAMPIVAYGLFCTLDELVRFVRLGRWAVPAQRALAVVLCLAAVQVLRKTPELTAGFQIPQARMLTRDMGRLIPGGSLVLTQRHLCEILGYFLPVESYPLAALLSDEPQFLRDIHRAVGAECAKERPVFCAEEPTLGKADFDVLVLRRLFDLDPLAVFPNAVYRLADPEEYAETFTLYRVRPWSQTRTEVRLGSATNANTVLQINAGMLWMEGSDRTYARLTLDGKLLDDRVENGANLYLLNAARRRGPGLLALESDRPIRKDIEPVQLAAGKPTEFEFVGMVEPSHWSMLSPEFIMPPTWRSLPRWQKEASVTLPNLSLPDTLCFATFTTRAYERDTNALVAFHASMNGETLGRTEILKEKAYHNLTLQIPVRPGGPAPRIKLTTDGLRGRPTTAALTNDAVELSAIYMQYVPLREGYAIDIGSAQDRPFVESGFFNREKHMGTTRIRWTGDRAVVKLFLEPADADAVLQFRFLDRYRPTNAPPANLQLAFNGGAVPLTQATGTADDEFVVATAVVPSAKIAGGANTLELTCNTWSPSEFLGTADHRQLGVMLDRIDVLRIRK